MNYVLKNKDFYIVFPQCTQAMALVAKSLAKDAYKELKNAQLSRMKVSKREIASAGTLRERSL